MRRRWRAVRQRWGGNGGGASAWGGGTADAWANLRHEADLRKPQLGGPKGPWRRRRNVVLPFSMAEFAPPWPCSPVRVPTHLHRSTTPGATQIAGVQFVTQAGSPGAGWRTTPCNAERTRGPLSAPTSDPEITNMRKSMRQTTLALGLGLA